MNKLLLIVFSFFLIITSCSQPAANQTKKDEPAIQQDTTTEVKTKYKSDIRKDLEGYFTHQKQGNDIEQVRAKGISFEANAEGFYCYFFIKNKKAISLKLHIQFPQYDADFIELYADGEVEVYEVNKSYSSNGSLNIAETYSKKWYDKSLNMTDEELLRKAASSDDVSLVFKTKANDVELGRIQLKKEECEALVRTIDYYKAHNSAKIPQKGMVNIRS